MNSTPGHSAGSSFETRAHILSGVDEADWRRLGYARFAGELSAMLQDEAKPAVLLSALPRTIAACFIERRWDWNGFYHLRVGGAPEAEARFLDLGHAHGPPVCTPLTRSQGQFASGMCWEAMLQNRALIATDVSRWPGYVSCDGSSGIATHASMVCPIRNAKFEPIGVWDVDVSSPRELADIRAMEAILGSLCEGWKLQAGDLAP